MEYTCKYCGKKFNARPASKRVYCSRKCMGLGTKNPERYCIDCGKKLSRKHKNIKCKDCMSPIRKHPNYNNGKMYITCSYCGKEIVRSIQLFSRNAKNHFCNKKCVGDYRRENNVGENSPAWKGGITVLYQKIRHLSKFTEWRTQVFARDGYRCQVCLINSKDLHAHHIITIRELLAKYNIKNSDDANNCLEFWDTNNGITLCKNCHINIHKKLKKVA